MSLGFGAVDGLFLLAGLILVEGGLVRVGFSFETFLEVMDDLHGEEDTLRRNSLDHASIS